MSFYKITDPKERRRMFEKLSQTRKNVREQFLEEKIGDIESRESLKKIFKPVTESQRELAEGIKEQLEPIRDKVLALPSPAPVLPIAGAEELTTALQCQSSSDQWMCPVDDQRANRSFVGDSLFFVEFS